MKNIMRKVLALGVAAAMTLSTATAFAADGGAVQSGIKATTAGGEKAAVTQPALGIDNPITFGLAADFKGGKALKADGDYSAIPVNYEADAKKLDSDIVTYGAQPSGTYDYCLITAKSTGKMYIVLQTDPANSAGVTVALGTRSGSQFLISKTTYLAADATNEGFGCIDVTAGQTYILGFQSSSAGRIAFAPYIYSYATRALPAGKAMMSSGVKGSSNAASTVLYKITPAKSGYIDVVLSNGGATYGKVTLLNSSKRAVSSTLSYNSKSKTGYVVFGVKKGKTYYLKVTGCTGLYSNQYMYAILYKATAGKIRANTKRSKSIKLKRKAKYTVTTAPAKTKGGKDWYKFKVTKKRKTQVRIDATNVKSGTMKVTCSAGKKKIATKTVVKGKVNTFTITHSTTYGKANRGTYYIVIQKSAKMNGQYRIKYLK